MRFVGVSSGVLHVAESGEADGGAPLVLIHSLGTDLRLWDAVLDRWPERRGRTIRFDLRGHGLSSCPEGHWTLEGLVEDTIELLDALDVRGGVVAGVSLGGLVAQGLAVRRPDLAGALVVANSAARMGTEALWRQRVEQLERDGLPALAEAILDRWFAPGWGEGLERIGWRHRLERTPLAGYVGCCRAIAGADLRESTATLTLPTLAIAGALDRACTPAEVERTAALVPNAAYARLENSAHLSCVDAPERFLDVLRPFVERHDERRRST